MSAKVKLMGRKRGMMQLFDDQGHAVACTVIYVEPNVVTQIKTKDKEGYNSLQLGCEKVVVNDPRTIQNRLTKAVIGHYKKHDVEPRKHLAETPLKSVEHYSLNQEINVTEFADVTYVDVIGISKGKGHQGVMKLHNFSGGRASHGSSFHRKHGSTGMRSTPGRVYPGMKMSGHMGAEQVTTQNLKVVKIVEEENVIIVRGAVPGAVGALVTIQESKKRPSTKRK